jgi:predicted amidophosphoribosyltransferase
MPNALDQLLLPAECLLCRNLLAFAEADRLVCAPCRYRWRPVRPPWCARCGQPGPSFGPCRLCARWPAALTSVRSAVWLDGGARVAVHALKYRGLGRVAPDLADVMVRHLPRPLAGAALVPVPLAPRRQRERGYNQSAQLATALGARWGTPVRDVLIRRRETRTQTALTPEARLANVAGAFQVRNGECGMRNEHHSAFRIPHSALGPTLVLVDDVFTTGATLVAAAAALAAAGASDIGAVTFGRAAIPDFT